MKYFKDSNNQVYAFEEDGSQDDFICSNHNAGTGPFYEKVSGATANWLASHLLCPVN